MFQCLQIDEVLRNTISYVQYPRDSSLRAFGLTCKTIYEPAMDALWEDQEGVSSLLYCLDSDMRELIEGEREWGRDELLRLPNSEEWSRITSYAIRVRTLTLCQEDFERPNISFSFLSRAASKSWSNPGHLYPRLHTLTLYTEILPGTLYAVLPPCLAVFALDGAVADDDLITSLLNIIGKHACNLTTMEFSPGESYQATLEHDITGAFNRNLCRLSSLTSVDVPVPLTESTLEHLSRLPGLTRLNCEIEDPDFRGIIKASLQTFPALTSLSIITGDAVDDVQTLTQFLTCLTFSPLSDLYILCSSSTNDPSLPLLFHAIVRFNELKKCDICVTESGQYFNQPIVLSADLIEPLYTLRGMEHLSLANLALDINPSDIPRIASAWPEIYTLNLGQTHASSPSNLTFEDLLPIAENCPSIRCLGVKLRFDSTASLAPIAHHNSNDRSMLPKPSSLSLLDIGCSDLRREQTPSLALALAAIYPDAEVITGSDFRTAGSERASAIEMLNKLKKEVLDMQPS